MSMREIMVHVTDGKDCVARLHAAAALARAHQARLTGLYTQWHAEAPPYVEAQLGPEVQALQQRLRDEQKETTKARFDDALADAGTSVRWHSCVGALRNLLTMHARYCDLLIMGRHGQDSSDPVINLVEAVVLESPKPVMLIPENGAPDGIGRRTVIAWNGTREAVRAVDAALPLLEHSEQVQILAVDPPDEPELLNGDRPGADLCDYLAGHGIKAEAAVVHSGSDSVGEVLLAQAMASGSDLLVMGVYGHARWRELILGGTTAHVLRRAKIPLLLAH